VRLPAPQPLMHCCGELGSLCEGAVGSTQRSLLLALEASTTSKVGGLPHIVAGARAFGHGMRRNMLDSATTAVDVATPCCHANMPRQLLRLVMFVMSLAATQSFQHREAAL
jgi:hypothetical protein